MPSALFLKLSSSYFFYFAVLGLVVPFLGIYLDGKSFSSVQIGEIIAIVTATKVVGPSIWAMLADRTGQQLRIIRLGSFLAFACFILLFWAENYWPITLFLSLFTLFWAAILPQIEVMTQNSIRRSAKIYARIRLWGSVGFIVLALLAGELMERFSADVFIIGGALVLLGLWLSTLLLKQPTIKASHLTRQSSIFSKILTLGFTVFFIAGLLLQVSFGAFYGFFALYLRDLSYGGFAIGLLISLGVVAEIIVFIYAGRLFKQFSVKTLLALSMLITALRWYLMAEYADNALLLALSQIMHAAGFALYHSASMVFLQQFFDDSQQSRAQAIYIGGVYGIGGAIGVYLAGLYWQSGQGAQITFMTAAGIAFIGAVLIVLLPKLKPRTIVGA